MKPHPNNEARLAAERRKASSWCSQWGQTKVTCTPVFMFPGLCGTFCFTCLGCQVAADMNECCLCGTTVAMRTLYRTRYGIPVSLLPLVSFQLASEWLPFDNIQALSLIGQNFVRSYNPKFSGHSSNTFFLSVPQRSIKEVTRVCNVYALGN